MFGKSSSSAEQIGLPNVTSAATSSATQPTYQNVVSNNIYTNQPTSGQFYRADQISTGLPTASSSSSSPPPPPPLPSSAHLSSVNSLQDLPLPPPPPASLLSMVNSDSNLGLPLVTPGSFASAIGRSQFSAQPVQPSFLQKRLNNIENSVPKPFDPNLVANTWRPVALHPLPATKPPEPLSNFRCTDIDQAPKTTAVLPPPQPPVASNKPITSFPVQVSSAVSGRHVNVSTHLNPVLKPQRKTVAQPAVQKQPDDDPSQLRNQLNRLLIDRQKLIQSQPPPVNNFGQTTQTSVIQPSHNVANSYASNGSRNALHVPNTVSKFGSGPRSGSTSPLSSVSSLGSAGSISPQSSASGARLGSATEPNKRRPSPLYQNSSEADVDYLTSLLVKGLNSKPKADEFQSTGSTSNIAHDICQKCTEPIKADESGCNAMGQMYHIKCFTCHVCNVPLRGVPFYAMDGKPFCEKDYLDTLEKCTVCSKPILDRLLRANGKPYHPECFCCVICGKCLDGIHFTVDSYNQIHCIEDFHKKFAPRCCVCNEPILPETGESETIRIVALDRSFHVKCYCCEDCGLQLSSDSKQKDLRCYPMDGHILCKNCNNRRITELITSEMTAKHS